MGVSHFRIMDHERNFVALEKKYVLHVVLRNFFQLIAHPHLLLMSGSLSEVLICFLGYFGFLDNKVY